MRYRGGVVEPTPPPGESPSGSVAGREGNPSAGSASGQAVDSQAVTASPVKRYAADTRAGRERAGGCQMSQKPSSLVFDGPHRTVAVLPGAAAHVGLQRVRVGTGARGVEKRE